MYLNGRGIRERTRQLNSEAWEACLTTYIGTCIYIISFTASMGLHMITGYKIWWLIFAVFALFFANWIPPWFRAMARLKAHIRAMDEETERLGPGWARD